MAFDGTRRFGGVARLYGEAGAARLRGAHVAVVGIGGVGSWCAEALARTGIGRLTLIDLDMLAESNANRQIHALDDLWGKAKVEAMKERIAAINPACRVACVEDWITPENVGNYLAGDYSVVIDAIDQARAKVAMIAHCQRRGVAIVVAGAAGGQVDPTRIKLADLSQTIQDPLLAKVRAQLRRDHGFPRGGKKFGVSAVFSTEPLRYPIADARAVLVQAPNTVRAEPVEARLKPPYSALRTVLRQAQDERECKDLNRKRANCAIPAGPMGLNCAGFGSSVCVTSVFGMVAAARAIELITADQATPVAPACSTQYPSPE
ncbi:MAG: tRNA threonylcarbamoyladenosine dehydratase [Azonexus sp.]|nr:tRNA threonylcarbamoyladenosine dehydratase [Azonexus sp.]